MENFPLKRRQLLYFLLPCQPDEDKSQINCLCNSYLENDKISEDKLHVSRRVFLTNHRQLSKLVTAVSVVITKFCFDNFVTEIVIRFVVHLQNVTWRLECRRRFVVWDFFHCSFAIAAICWNRKQMYNTSKASRIQDRPRAHYFARKRYFPTNNSTNN